MKIKTCLWLGFSFSIIGTIIGWHIGEQKGIAELPPDAWAGDGIGILSESIYGAQWGGLVGLCSGILCFLTWHLVNKQRRSRRLSVTEQPNKTGAA